jgi:hypothetical protein
MAEADFLVTLPSNSNMSTNPSNEPANYTVKLAEPLKLDGEWEAALVSVQYTPTWLSFTRTQYLIVSYVKYDSDVADPRSRTFKNLADFAKWHEILGKHDLLFTQKYRQAPAGMKINVVVVVPKYHDSAMSLGADICKAINEATYLDGVTVRYEFDHATKRGFFVVIGGEMQIAAENYMALGELLGHYVQWVKCDKCTTYDRKVHNSSHFYTITLFATSAPRLIRVNSLWVYNNITQNQQVGDTKAPLLGIIPTNNDVGRRVHYTVNPVHFLALNRSHIPEITIKITDDAGNRIPFGTENSEDNLVCCLRFRRRKAHMLV